MADYSNIISSGLQAGTGIASDIYRTNAARDLKNQELQQQLGLKYLEIQKQNEENFQKRKNEIISSAQKKALDVWKAYKDSGQVVSLDGLESKFILDGLQQAPDVLEEIEKRDAIQNAQRQQIQMMQQQKLQQQQTQKATQGAMQTLGEVDVTFKPNDSTTIKTTGDKVAALSMNPVTKPMMQGLARATFYNPTEDQYGSQTAKPHPETGVNQAQELTTVAVDPKIIPYGSKLQIPELAKKMGLPEDHLFLAHDTGGAVKSQQASGGQMPVIDVYTNSPQQMNQMSNQAGVGGYAYKIVENPQSRGDVVTSMQPSNGLAKPASISSDISLMGAAQKVQNMPAPEQTPTVMHTDKTPIPSAEQASEQARYGVNVPRGTQPLNNQLNEQLSLAEQQLAAKLKADEEAKRKKEKIEQDRFDLSRKQYELSNRQYEEEKPYKSAQLNKMQLDAQKVEQELAGLKSTGKTSKMTEGDKSFAVNADQLLKNLDTLESAIKRSGTFEYSGAGAGLVKGKSSIEDAATIKSLPYEIAVGVAKILDPASVAREGEVAAAQKFIIPTGISESNDIAIKAIQQLKNRIKDRSSVYQNADQKQQETGGYVIGGIYGGMKYKGGNPNDENNWEKK